MSCPYCGQRHDSTACPGHLPASDTTADLERALIPTALERIEHSLSGLVEQMRQVNNRLDEIEHRLRSGAADEEEG